MMILHIANDFAGSKVHKNLFEKLDAKGVSQIVYCPIRDANQIGGNAFNSTRAKFIYSNIIKPYHKYMYHIKQGILYSDMTRMIDLSTIDVVHAATVFSDGGLAYKLYKQYGIPYIVAVRNTDVNGFLKKLPHSWWNGIQILLHAQKIIFISNGLRHTFEKHIAIRPILKKIKDKSILLPNGIDNYFLDHICCERRSGNKIVYVGDFSNNKNIIRLGKAILQLRKEPNFEDTTLTIVGGGKNETDEVTNMIETNPNIFQYLGKIYEKDKLCKIFRNNNIFAMPSIHETFGLVYLEALSQNLPVLYTKHQGVDGLLPDTAGIGVNPLSISEITDALRKLLSHNAYYSNSGVDFSRFRWENISERYVDIYRKCIMR